MVLHQPPLLAQLILVMLDRLLAKLDEALAD